MSFWQHRARKLFWVGIGLALAQLALIGFDLSTGRWLWAVAPVLSVGFLSFFIAMNWRTWHRTTEPIFTHDRHEEER